MNKYLLFYKKSSTFAAANESMSVQRHFLNKF